MPTIWSLTKQRVTSGMKTTTWPPTTCSTPALSSNNALYLPAKLQTLSETHSLTDFNKAQLNEDTLFN